MEFSLRDIVAAFIIFVKIYMTKYFLYFCLKYYLKNVNFLFSPRKKNLSKKSSFVINNIFEDMNNNVFILIGMTCIMC